MKVLLFRSQSEVSEAFVNQNIRIFSCLNGFTLNLLNSGAYDYLLSNLPIGFVVDGISAHWKLKKNGILVEKTLGRELMDLAINLHPNSIFIIGGSPQNYGFIKKKLDFYFNFNFNLITPPLFKTQDQLRAYAKRVSKLIPNNSLVIIFIKSPLQDSLSGYLCELTSKTIFINAGAVIDDILNERFVRLNFFQKMKLEWLFRLFVSPKRTLPKLLNMLIFSRLNLKKYDFKVLN